MNIFKILFNNPKIECPRCLGKGEVDWDDIKRLNRELRWIPGKCAYCNGKRKVSAWTASRLKADTTYLTLDISQEERRRLFSGDKGALYRAEVHDNNYSDFIKQVEYLHTVGNLDPHQIMGFWLIPKSASNNEIEKKELLNYIEKIIRKKNGEG